MFAQLKTYLTGGPDPLPNYADLSEQLNLPMATLRSDVSRLRARYRQALRNEIRPTVDSEAAVDGELHELLRILLAR